MENEKYVSPSMEDIGTTAESRGAVAFAFAAIIAAAVYNGVVLINYGLAINVGGGVNVATKVNAVTG